MQVTDAQIDHFHRNGFFLTPNPFEHDRISQIDRLQQDNEKKWEETEWPDGFNIMACQFLMLDEPVLQLVEHPDLVQMAKNIMDCEEVHIGACGCGDASKVIAADGRERRQVHWHADGAPNTDQVSVRIGLDRHNPDNGPLRVLPGSHRRPREEVQEEITQLELATGRHHAAPELCFVRHPHEIEVMLNPDWALVWTPNCWHATGLKTAAGPRRAIAWNYLPPGGRKRDIEAIKLIYKDKWPSWPETRQRLWGLID